jgi:hypothetical protein
MEMTQEKIVAELRSMENVTSRDAACSTLATFVVEDGRPGPQKG